LADAEPAECAPRTTPMHLQNAVGIKKN